jgi:hypothetical protein
VDALFSILTIENAPEFFKLADEFNFNLIGLKNKAVQIMSANIDCSNFYDRYMFATENHCKELEEAVGQFLKENYCQASKTDDWKKFPVEFRTNIIESLLDMSDKPSKLTYNHLISTWYRGKSFSGP